MSNPNPTTGARLVDVAVGVVTRDDGQVLLGQRPKGKPYAGWWEFPGGKLEAGETVHQALVRELAEELGLTVHRSAPWLIREYVYEHAHVRLHFRRVADFSGQPQPREGQALVWTDPVRAPVTPLLPATVPLMRLLSLPAVYGISCATEMGVDGFVAMLKSLLARMPLVLQLREPGMSDHEFAQLFDRVLAMCQDNNTPLLVNSCHEPAYWQRAGGVHLRAADIDRFGREAGRRTTADGNNNATDDAGLTWVAASCHNPDELSRAANAGVDFATLSPVKPTLSHPGAWAMGWSGFELMVEQSRLPVYGLGGLSVDDLPPARVAGAHGVAMIRSLFRHNDSYPNRVNRS